MPHTGLQFDIDRARAQKANMSNPEYTSKSYQAARRALLADNPICHWCRRRPATEADHLIEVERGGTHNDGMVPSCKPCNSARGAAFRNRKLANAKQQRDKALNDFADHVANLGKCRHMAVFADQ